MVLSVLLVPLNFIHLWIINNGRFYPFYYKLKSFQLAKSICHLVKLSVVMHTALSLIGLYVAEVVLLIGNPTFATTILVRRFVKCTLTRHICACNDEKILSLFKTAMLTIVSGCNKLDVLHLKSTAPLFQLRKHIHWWLKYNLQDTRSSRMALNHVVTPVLWVSNPCSIV
jgi:hypothetical protein